MFKHVIQDNVSHTHDIKSVTYSTHNHKHLHVDIYYILSNKYRVFAYAIQQTL